MSPAGASMFPAGAPGLGTLILRISVAASLHVEVCGHFAGYPNTPAFIALSALATLLVAGFLTPLAAVLAAIVEAALLIAGAANAALVLLGPVDAAVLLLLGPGAYSLDARLFGRRVVVLRPARSKQGR